MNFLKKGTENLLLSQRMRLRDETGRQVSSKAIEVRFISFISNVGLLSTESKLTTVRGLLIM